MARLLAADAVAVCLHRLVDVLVAHVRLYGVDAGLLQGLEQAEVRLGGGNHRVADELPALLHVLAVHVQDVVAGHDISLLIDRKAAVRVAVVGKADIQAVLQDKVLEGLDVGGAHVPVDVEAVWLVADHIGVRAEGIEHRLCDGPGAAVCAVKADFDAAEVVDAEGDEVPDVAVSARDVVDGRADAIALCKGEGVPVRIKDVEAPVQPVLDETDHLVLHLLAQVIYELDAVVVEGVVACGDHDAAVKAVDPRDVGHRGGGGHVEEIGLSAGGGDATDERVLEHVGGAAGVLADDDPCGVTRSLSSLLLRVIPADEPSDLVGVVCRQGRARLSAKAIRSKVSSHLFSPCRFCRFYLLCLCPVLTRPFVPSPAGR